jgi:hypothetical protein
MFIMGGREKFAAKLDELFTTKQKLTGRDQPDITGLIGQYAHGNEPSHHILISTTTRVNHGRRSDTSGRSSMNSTRTHPMD